MLPDIGHRGDDYVVGLRFNMVARNAPDFGNMVTPAIAIKCTIHVLILQLFKKNSSIPLLPNFET